MHNHALQNVPSQTDTHILIIHGGRLTDAWSPHCQSGFSCRVPAEDTRGTVFEKLSVANQAVPFKFLLKADATKVYWIFKGKLWIIQTGGVLYLRAAITACIRLGLWQNVFFTMFEGTHNKNHNISRIANHQTEWLYSCWLSLGTMMRGIMSWDDRGSAKELNFV